MTSLNNFLIAVMLLFAWGFIVRVIRSDLRLSADLAKILSIYYHGQGCDSERTSAYFAGQFARQDP